MDGTTKGRAGEVVTGIAQVHKTPFNYVPSIDAILSLKQAADRIVQLEHQVARLLEAVPSAQVRDEEKARDEQEADARTDGDLSEPIEDDLPF